MNTQEIKAVETDYKGYKFRSRLEARWAVFFDKSEISWEYEPQTYEMKNGRRYLPDFYLPDDDIYFEIKGVMPDEDYLKNKLERFAIEKNTRVLLAVGILGEGKCLLFSPKTKMWQQCFILCSGQFSLNYNGRFGKLHFFQCEGMNDLEALRAYGKLLISNMYHKRIACIDAMKQARFEYLQTPKHA